mgnify:CR=1 FL=1
MNSWLIVKDQMDNLIKPDGTKEPSNIIGAFQPNKFGNEIPIGMHLWNLTTEECNGMVHLKLTGVILSKYNTLFFYSNAIVSHLF